MKKILFCYGDRKTTGASIVLLELLKELKKEKDLYIEVLFKQNGYDSFKEKFDKLNLNYNILFDENKYFAKKYIKYKGENKFIASSVKIIRSLERKRTFKKASKGFDIIIDFSVLDFDKYILKTKGRKLSTFHMSISSFNKKELKRIKNIERKYNNIIMICDEMKKEFENILGKSEKLVRIYNPFNIKKIKEKSEDKSLLNNLELDLIKENYIVSLTRLDSRQKDVMTLMKAYKFAKEKGIKEKLYIAGEGEQRRKIEEWIRKNNLKKDIILLGLQKNPYVWLKNSKLFVLSSKYEGLPTVLIESMICKVPIISTNCPTGPKEILGNGKFGSLIKIGDYVAMGEEIINIIVNNKKEKELLMEKEILKYDSRKVALEYKKFILGE